MTHYFTRDQHTAWRKAQPEKMVVAKVIIQSPDSNVLLLKSAYKNNWQLPGGGVNDQESPKQAAVREVGEETGLSIDEDDLILQGTIYEAKEEALFLVYSLKRTYEEDIPITVQVSEVEASEFVSPSEVPQRLSKYYGPFWNSFIS